MSLASTSDVPVPNTHGPLVKARRRASAVWGFSLLIAVLLAGRQQAIAAIAITGSVQLGLDETLSFLLSFLR